MWKDEGLTDYTFIDLLADVRGGRQGFPPKVVDELRALYELHLMRVDAHPERGRQMAGLDTGLSCAVVVRAAMKVHDL